MMEKTCFSYVETSLRFINITCSPVDGNDLLRKRFLSSFKNRTICFEYDRMCALFNFFLNLHSLSTTYLQVCSVVTLFMYAILFKFSVCCVLSLVYSSYLQL